MADFAGAEGATGPAEAVRPISWNKAREAALRAEDAYDAAKAAGNPKAIVAAAEAWLRAAKVAVASANNIRKAKDAGPAQDQAVGMEWRATQASRYAATLTIPEEAETDPSPSATKSWFSAAKEKIGEWGKAAKDGLAALSRKRGATPTDGVIDAEFEEVDKEKGPKLFSKESLTKAKDILKNRLDGLKDTWGRDGAALLVGAGVGALAKRTLYGLTASTGIGYVGSIAAGALYGAATGMAAEVGSSVYRKWEQSRQFDAFAREMQQGLDASSEEEEVGLWAKKYRALQQALTEADPAQKRKIEKQLSAARLYAKVRAEEENISVRDQAKQLATAILGIRAEDAPEEVAGLEAELDAEIEGAEFFQTDWVKVGKAARRGAIFGAIGAATLGVFDGSAAEALGAVGESIQGSLTSASEIVGLDDSGGVVSGSEVTPNIAPSELPTDDYDVTSGTEVAQEVSEGGAPAESYVTESETSDAAASETTEAAATETIVLDLAAGSNPWETVEASLGFTPTNAQMVEIMTRVAEDSDFSVSEWGVMTGPDDQALQAGFDIKISPETQAFIDSLRR